MKISSKTFNDYHVKELDRYIFNQKKCIHIMSDNTSHIENFQKISETLLLTPDKNIFALIHELENNYDLIVITDLFELTDDIYNFFKIIKTKLTNDGKLLITSVNPKWNKLIRLFEISGLKKDSKKRAYIHPVKINNIGRSLGFEIIQYYSRQIFPFSALGLGKILNKIFELFLLPFNLGIKNYIVFSHFNNEIDKKSKSIIIPAKNEELNLVPLIERIPVFEEPYELIVIYGDSDDKTEEIVLSLGTKFPNRNIVAMKQTKNGKANAVWEAVEASRHDLLAILDSDQSVDPETLTEFFEIIESGNADFVNGTRLIYPMEQDAMRAINTVGNKIFQFLISLVIGQKLTDSLCGTKVFRREDIDRIHRWQKRLKSKDPFGDFDLIFSAAYSGNKILEYPVHYRARVYGETQISRFRDGYKLIIYFLESFYYFNFSK
tara:strand:- start:1776 stop:3080 length:1305 start_codon:yes stop_codon:yes gene_type:complete